MGAAQSAERVDTGKTKVEIPVVSLRSGVDFCRAHAHEGRDRLARGVGTGAWDLERATAGVVSHALAVVAQNCWEVVVGWVSR